LAEEYSGLWQDAAAEEVVLRCIALKRKYELALDYERQAALAAAKTQATPELDGSIRLLGKRARQRQGREKRRQAWRRGLSVALVLLAALLACPTIAFAVSPAFREAVYEYTLDWQDVYMEIRPVEKCAPLIEPYYLGWLPEGFTLVDESHDPILILYNYEKGGQYVNLLIGTADTETNLDTERTVIERRQINGYDAIVGRGDDSFLLLWNNGSVSFSLYTNLDWETTEKIAENIRPGTGD